MRKTWRFWLVLGSLILLGFLAVAIGTGYYAGYFELRQMNTPGVPKVTVLGSRRDVVWTEIPVSDLRKPEWNMPFWPSLDNGKVFNRETQRIIDQDLLIIRVPPVSGSPGPDEGASVEAEVHVTVTVSEDANDYYFNFSGDTGYSTAYKGTPTLVLQRRFDEKSKTLHVLVAWSFPGQRTAKKCDLVFRLTANGLVFVGQEDPNAAPARSVGQ